MSTHHIATLALALATSLLTLAGCAQDPAESAAGDCESDSDCKGSRVCERGECVDPEGGSQGAASSGGGSCSGDEMMCADAQTLQFCAEGTFHTQSCSDVCGEVGFASEGCQGTNCQCGEPTDAFCLQGMQAVCVCAESAGQPCTDDDAVNLYVGCHTGSDTDGVVACFSSHVSGNEIDCSAAVNSCL